MSLINDLLRDLHERNVTSAGSASLTDLRPVRKARRGRSLALPIAALLVASSAFAVYRADGVSDDAATVVVVKPAAAPAQVTPVAAAPAPAAVAPPSATRTADARFASLIDFTRSLDNAPARREARRRTDAAAKPSTQAKAKPPAAQKAPTVAAPKVAVKNPRGDGLAALADGRPADAQKQFRALVALEPTDADAWLYLARAQHDQGRAGAAEATLSEALLQVAAPAPIARALARRLLARGSTAEALKMLRAYRPRDYLEPDHDAFIAAVQQRLGRHDAAAEHYRGVLSVRPQAAGWWVGLAISEEALGRDDEALAAYRHAENIGNLDPRLAAYAQRRIAAMQGIDPS